MSTARRRRSGEVARRSLASLFLRLSVYETRRESDAGDELPGSCHLSAGVEVPVL